MLNGGVIYEERACLQDIIASQIKVVRQLWDCCVCMLYVIVPRRLYAKQIASNCRTGDSLHDLGQRMIVLFAANRSIDVPVWQRPDRP